MKIAILTDTIAPLLGGAVGVAWQHARGLNRRGHQVTVLAATGSVPPDRGINLRLVSRPFPERWSAYLGLHHPAAVRAVTRELARLQPDVVHAHNLYYALSYRCLAAARQFTPRVFLTAHDVQSFAYAKLTHYIDPQRWDVPARPDYRTPWWVNLRTAKKRYNPLRNTIIRHHVQRITKVFAVSQALADALHDNGITNVAVLHNGIDLADWKQPSTRALQDFRNRHGLAQHKVVLFSGRISGAKGINQILGALGRVVSSIPATRLLIAGGAEGNLAAYRTLPQKFGVAAHVQFAGQLAPTEMISAYHTADVVVVPSVCFDSFPSTNLEAMAAGKPVIATCFGGSREAVADGQTGYIVNPYDTAALAERVTRLLADPELAARLGSAARRRVEQEFSAHRWLDELESWYGNTPRRLTNFSAPS